jgi:hypothetical protein
MTEVEPTKSKAEAEPPRRSKTHPHDPAHHEAQRYAQRRGYAAADARYAAEIAVGAPYGEPVVASKWSRPPGEVYRFDGMTLVHGRVGVIAAKKVGKTTFILSVALAYLDGAPLLRAWPMSEPFNERVLLMNFELPDAYLWSECNRLGLLARDRLLVWNLRGRENPLATERGRRDTAKRLDGEGVGVVFVDPLGAATRGVVDNDNDNAQLRYFLGALDEVVSMERDLWVPMHAGHGPDDRARGASEIEGWADTLVSISRDRASDPDTRYLAVEGRGVAHPLTSAEGMAIRYDPLTSGVWVDLAAPSRREATTARRTATRRAELRDRALTTVRDEPGILKGALEKSVGGNASEARGVIAELVRDRQIRAVPGTNRKVEHFPVEPS